MKPSSEERRALRKKIDAGVKKGIAKAIGCWPLPESSAQPAGKHFSTKQEAIAYGKALVQRARNRDSSI